MIDRSDRLHRFPFSVLPGSWMLLGGFIVCLGAGCSTFSSDEKPLPDTTFTRLLTELHLATARHNTEAPSPPGLRDSIFARYDVRPSAFEATLEYYSRHPNAFEPLYRSITDTLQALQYARKQRNLPDSVPDSAARAK